MLGQSNFLGQVVEHQQRTIESHLGHFDIGDRSGKNGLAISLLADIANETLYDLAFDPAALYLGQIDLAADPVLADITHCSE